MIVLTLLVRDEEDILEANLDFHLSMGVDFVIATDHRSADGTRSILERYQRAGYLRMICEETEAYEQSRWVTSMARMAYAMGASWVINGDADEFWWPMQGDLTRALAAVPAAYDVVLARRRDFPPVRNPSLGRFWERMVYRDSESFNLLGEPLPAKVCHRARADVSVAQGNHSVSAKGLGLTLDDGRIEILHFPLRTFGQFERKIVNGGSAYDAPGAPPGVGGTWRHAYLLHKAGRLPELYEQRVLDRRRLTERLAAGQVAEDTRLRQVLSRVTRTYPPTRSGRRLPSRNLGR